MRRPGNINNLNQIFNSFTPKDLGLTRSQYVIAKSRVMNQQLSYSEKNLNVLARNVPKGFMVKSRIKNARYNWLFDDLQEFTARDFNSLKSKKEIQEVLEDIMPKQNDATISKLSVGLNNARLRPEIRERPRRRVRRFTRTQALNDAVRLVGRAKASRLVSFANKENAFLVNNDIVVRARNKKGKVFYRDFKTGRFAKNPLLTKK